MKKWPIQGGIGHFSLLLSRFVSETDSLEKFDFPIPKGFRYLVSNSAAFWIHVRTWDFVTAHFVTDPT